MNAFEVLQSRGFVQQYTAGAPDLLAGDPVAFYVGFDPTADSLHVGHLLPIMAMAHLQRAGHRPIAVVGGGTAMVGDPSGKDEMRQLISTDQIEANKRTMRALIGKLLDFSEGQGQLIDNADWLLPLNYIAFLREIGRHFSVNQMLGKASVKLRLEKGLSFIEFNYQLLQAYDFLELYRTQGCKLQMGGDDQWGNITAGIDLIRRVTGGEAHGLTFPLLTTASGKKMGKTEKGAVWISADRLPVYEYYQYWYNVDDRDLGKLLRIFTFLSLEEIAAIEALPIQEAKKRLAIEATAVVHGMEAATKAAGKGKMAGEHAVELPALVRDVLAESGLCKSKGDARRQIQGGAIKLAGQRIADVDAQITAADLSDGAVVLSFGKKRKIRLVEA